MLDANAIAGLLQEIYGVEMTTARGTCAHCGRTSQLGAVRVYLGAGVVVRCPHCGNVLGQIVTRGTTICVGLPGVRDLRS